MTSITVRLLLKLSYFKKKKYSSAKMSDLFSNLCILSCIKWKGKIIFSATRENICVIRILE